MPQKNNAIEYVSASTAMNLLAISRHNFNKIVEDGVLVPDIVDGKKYFSLKKVSSFKNSKDYAALQEGIPFLRILPC